MLVSAKSSLWTINLKKKDKWSSVQTFCDNFCYVYSIFSLKAHKKFQIALVRTILYVLKRLNNINYFLIKKILNLINNTLTMIYLKTKGLNAILMWTFI